MHEEDLANRGTASVVVIDWIAEIDMKEEKGDELALNEETGGREKNVCSIICSMVHMMNIREEKAIEKKGRSEEWI